MQRHDQVNPEKTPPPRYHAAWSFHGPSCVKGVSQISVRATVKRAVPDLQWSNYGGARGGLAHLKDLAAPRNMF